MLQKQLIAGALVACATAIGCGGAAVPRAGLTQSAASIRAAEEVGANETPKAALHLKLAREERQRALDLIRDDKNEEAKRSLMRADADAELALTLAREDQTRRAANDVLQEVRALRSKL